MMVQCSARTSLRKDCLLQVAHMTFNTLQLLLVETLHNSLHGTANRFTISYSIADFHLLGAVGASSYTSDIRYSHNKNSRTVTSREGAAHQSVSQNRSHKRPGNISLRNALLCFAV